MYARIQDLQQRRRDIITVKNSQNYDASPGLLEAARSAKRSFSSYESKKK